MNYIELINSFWVYRRSHPMLSPEADLYFYLLKECNNRMWQNPFSIPTRQIEYELCMSRKTLADYRNRLIQRELIDYVVPKGRAHPLYIITGVPIKEEPTESPPEVAIASPKPTINIETERVVPISTEKEYSLKDNDIIVEITQHQQEWIELFCMNNHLSIQHFNIHINLFLEELQNRGEKAKTISDFKHHFSSWYNIQKQRQSNGSKTTISATRADQRQQQSEQHIADAISRIDAIERSWQKPNAVPVESSGAIPFAKDSDSGILSIDADYPFK